MLGDISKLTKIQTPFYLYNKNTILSQYQQLSSMSNAYGLEIAYAMKAMPNQHVLKIFKSLGSKIDASSFNQVKRAINAGFQPEDITYTTQQILKNRTLLDEMKNFLIKGMKFNVCSLRQFDTVKDVVKANNIKLCVRVHPGKGAGQSNSRNTGDQYSCFGVHLKDIPTLLSKANAQNIVFDEIHIHVGSGGKVSAWKQHITEQIDICKKYFKGITLNKINFGGGFKVARMPDEQTVDIKAIGEILKRQVQKFGEQTKTKPITVVQSGTFLMANSGYVVTSILDIKQTQKFQFLILDGGMQVNTRPILYGSRHPFYLYSENGSLKSSQYQDESKKRSYVVVGRCCESGDSQTLQVIEYDNNQTHSHEDKFKIAPRAMGIAQVGDLLIIGGSGAYCSGMTLNNYNSHFISAEYLIQQNGCIVRIRKQQQFEQIIANEVLQQLSN